MRCTKQLESSLANVEAAAAERRLPNQMEEEGAETRIQGELEQNDEVDSDEDHCREVVTEGRKLDPADAPLCQLPPGRRRDVRARSSERSSAAYRLMVVFKYE